MLRAMKQERFAPSRKKLMMMSPRLMRKTSRHQKMLQTIRGGHRHMIGTRKGMK